MKKQLCTFIAVLVMANLPLLADPPKVQSGNNSSSSSSQGGDSSGGSSGGSSGSSPSTNSSSSTSPSGSGGQVIGGGKGGGTTQQKPQSMPFAVFIDQGGRGNHYIPSGWMGDYGDLKMNPGCTQNPHGGKSCIQITYSAKMTNSAGWAGIFWQYPANNWGNKPGGFNLTGAKKLTFWARGAKGGEKIAEFKVGGISGEYPDSDTVSSGPVELTPQWKQYTLDLQGKDLSTIIGAFAWAASKDDNPDGFTIFLDDIQFE